MPSTPVTIRGILHPDGSLELEGQVDLPPGQVQITLTPWPSLPPNDPLETLLQRIWAGQQARGHVPRSVSEVESERHQTADDWDQRMAEIARIQTEAARLRSLEPPRS
jgi:hypothetical protein